MFTLEDDDVDRISAYFEAHTYVTMAMLHAIGLDYSSDEVWDMVTDSINDDVIWTANGYQMKLSTIASSGLAALMFGIFVMGE